MNNRLKIQKILRSVILDGLNTIGYTGWDVVEFSPPQMTNANNIVMMNLVRRQRLGWQHENYVVGESDNYHRKDEWIELQHWQLHLIAKRPVNATSTTIVVDDVASDLISFLNGPGMDMFRANGIAPERIDGDSILVYNDDNEIYQKRCVFTVKIEVPKELKFNQDEVEAVMPDIQPV